MSENTLAQAIALAKRGKNDEARHLLLLILKDEPHNETAWLALAQTFPDEPSRIKVLYRCLQFNPDSQKARQELESLWARSAGLDAPTRPAQQLALTSAPGKAPSRLELPKVPAFLDGSFEMPGETPAGPEPAPAAPSAPPAVPSTPPAAPAAPPADTGTPPPEQPPPAQPSQKGSRARTLDYVMVTLIVLFVAVIAGYLLWNRYPLSAIFAGAQATQTANLTAAPTSTASPSLSATPRLTNTALISPTPTLDPNSPILLYGGSNDCEVRAISLVGGQNIPLATEIPDNCTRVRISPDGQKVLYSVQEGASDDQTGSVEVTSLHEPSSFQILDRIKFLYLADWAPDSQWVSYLTVAGLNQAGPVFGLNLIRADGSGHFQLTDERAGSIDLLGESVAWSPDGRWLAFVANGSLQIVRIDGSGLLTLVNDFKLIAMAWSPDSSRIAYYLPNGAGIQLVNLEGDRQLVQNSSLTTPDFGQSLAWSADGTRLVAFNQIGKALLTVSMDGQTLNPLLNTGGLVRQVSVSPNDDFLAYVEVTSPADETGSLKVYNFETGEQASLAEGVAADIPLVWELPAEQEGMTTPIPITPPTPTITSTPTQAGSLGSGLFLYYNFNADPVGSVRDWSGNEHHGLLQGGDYQPVYGPQKALVFSDTSIETTDPFNGLEVEKLTLSFFYQPAQGNITNPGALFSWSSSAFPGPTVDLFYQMENPDDPAVFIEGTGADLVGIDADGQIRHHFIVTSRLQTLWDANAPRWYHLAITYDQTSGIAQIYIDGRLDTSRNLGKFTLLTSGFNLIIGQNPSGNSADLEGSVDEIRLYDRVLTAAEILKLAQVKVP
jgi:WD40 repeat protein